MSFKIRTVDWRKFEVVIICFLFVYSPVISHSICFKHWLLYSISLKVNWKLYWKVFFLLIVSRCDHTFKEPLILTFKSCWGEVPLGEDPLKFNSQITSKNISIWLHWRVLLFSCLQYKSFWFIFMLRYAL